MNPSYQHGPRATTPRKFAGSSLPPKHGASVRQACQDKAVQDLMYRTEYLATLRSGIAAVKAPPGEEAYQTQSQFPAPNVIGGMALQLQQKHIQRQAPSTPLK